MKLKIALRRALILFSVLLFAQGCFPLPNASNALAQNYPPERRRDRDRDRRDDDQDRDRDSDRDRGRDRYDEDYYDYNLIFFAYRAVHEERILFSTWDGGRWSSGERIPDALSDVAPALTRDGDTIYLAYKGRSSDKIF